MPDTCFPGVFAGPSFSQDSTGRATATRMQCAPPPTVNNPQASRLDILTMLLSLSITLLPTYALLLWLLWLLLMGSNCLHDINSSYHRFIIIIAFRSRRSTPLKPFWLSCPLAILSYDLALRTHNSLTSHNLLIVTTAGWRFKKSHPS